MRRVSSVALAKASPASQDSLSASWFSLNSCATLSWAIGAERAATPCARSGPRPPGSEQPLRSQRVGRGGEAASHLALAEHLRQLAEDLEVQVGGFLGHQQHEDQSDRDVVQRVEGDRRAGADQAA